ncbi:hypothetical protein [Magnetospira sp. QH-2]|uniref:hypothetical protein n=1 Tax=Magnetospira sp. (strain QH-2) TaxID=1288970 RepID=UPI0005F9C16F|nr:hypothetical protein [Magnetospira sp. QH-2]
MILLTGGSFAVANWMGYDLIAMIMGTEVEPEPEPVPVEEPLYVDLEPLLVPLIQGDRMQATVTIEVKFECMGKENEDKIKRLAPKLSDTFLRDLYSYLPRMLRKTSEVDLALLKDRLLLLSAKATGDPDLVRDLTVKADIQQSK